MTLEEMGKKAREVSRVLGTLGSREKNIGLEEAARALLEGEEEILLANEAEFSAVRTILAGKNAGLSSEKIVERLRESYVV